MNMDEHGFIFFHVDGADPPISALWSVGFVGSASIPAEKGRVKNHAMFFRVSPSKQHIPLSHSVFLYISIFCGENHTKITYEHDFLVIMIPYCPMLFHMIPYYQHINHNQYPFTN